MKIQIWIHSSWWLGKGYNWFPLHFPQMFPVGELANFYAYWPADFLLNFAAFQQEKTLH